jgi:hypothetical protein
LTGDGVGISNSTALLSEDINVTAEAIQTIPNNLSQSNYPTQDLEASKREDTEADVWGIKGLLGIIKSEDSDKSKLALGVDLTSLGLNMNQPEYSPIPKKPLVDLVFVHCFLCSALRGRIYHGNRRCRISIQNTIYQHVIG